MFEIVGREEQVFEQWEQGVTLSNPCMKAGDEVVFRNSSGATYVMIAGASGVEVPNKLLQMTCNILVDLEQGKEQHSDCQTVFAVNPADKPDDYVYVDNTIRKQEAQPTGGGGGLTMLYFNPGNGPYVYKTPNCREEDKLSKDELMECVRSSMVVAAIIGGGLEGYYYPLSAGTSDEFDYAWLKVDGGELYSKEYIGMAE